MTQRHGHALPAASEAADAGDERARPPDQDLDDQTAALVAARNAAVAADRARTAFFAAVSHDLRTPIHSVLAAADQLQEHTSDADAPLIATIQSATRELLARLDELMVLAQPPAHENLHPVAARIPEVLAHAISAYDTLFQDDQSAIHVALDPSLEQEVLIQKAGFLRIVDALFAEFRLLPATSRVAMSMRVDGSSLLISLTGLTEPWRTWSWALVEQAVAAVQGTITHRPTDRPDALTISIPVQPTQGHRIGHGNRVLLVDDTAVTRQLGDAMLRSLGVQVDVADGGQAAIDAVAAHTYGLVLMDIRMPDLDGLSATREIRAGRAGADAAQVPIVALTADAVPGAREQALMVGMDDFVTKPFSRESLRSVLDRYLDPTPAP